MPEINPPKLSPCEPWPLIEQLDHEKEVTGMYMSGHPLDNFKFEMKHYNITPLADYNEFKAAISTHPNPAKQFRVAVWWWMHNIVLLRPEKFCRSAIEDYSGKTEFMLWSEDYVKYTNYLEKG
jgi:DNA polymerase-3 subunit alpha